MVKQGIFQSARFRRSLHAKASGDQSMGEYVSLPLSEVETNMFKGGGEIYVWVCIWVCVGKTEL